jgi:glutathione S-transferase
MTLRTKKDRHIKDATASARRLQRIPLPQNSLFVLGPRTNRHWLHGIRPDKRQAAEKSPSETAFNGERISITLRHIGTFTDKDNRKIWGQGAVAKSRQTAGTISTTNSAEMEAMVIAFGKENQQINFDWDAEYGGGFDVINLVSDVTMLQLCGDKIADLRVMLSIYERNVPCVMARSKPSETQNSTPTSKSKTILALSSDDKPIFRDTDEASSELIGDLAILFHLGEFYPLQPAGEISEREMHRLTSRALGRITQANELLSLWQEIQGSSTTAPIKASHTLHLVDSSKAGSEENILEAFLGELEIWEEYADEADYMGGDFYATVDCAFWPVLNDIVENWEGWNDNKYPDLAAYHKRVSSIASVGKATQKIQEIFT